MKTRLTFWILVIVLIILIAGQAYLQDKAFERSIYFVLMLIIIAWLITSRSIEKCAIIRKTRENRQQVGQILIERFEFSNDANLPKFWVSIKDLSNLNQETEIKLLAWVAPKTKVSYVTQTLIEKRGNYELGPIKITSGDPFGLFVKSNLFEAREKLLVIPNYEKLDFFPNPSGLLMGGNAKKTRHLEVSPYAVSVREYSPGDPLRRIDWKSSARLEKLMVKEFEQDPQSNIWVILDGDKNHHHFTEKKENINFSGPIILRSLADASDYLPCDTFEYAVSITASICNYYISQGKTVGFSTNAQQKLLLAPERGSRQMDKILNSLALVQPESDEDLLQFIESQITQIKKGSTVVLISSTPSEELLNSIESMKKRSLFPIFIGINSATFGPFEGNEKLVTEMLASGVFTLSMGYQEHLSQKISNIPSIN